MKKILVTAMAIGSVCIGPRALAASGDDLAVRLAALEQENAAIRKENAVLRENKKLREQNASLKSSAPGPAAAGPRDPLSAYAADMPIAYKAPAAYEPGRFRVWGEGGAIWTGGDPVSSAYMLGSGILVGAFVGGAVNPQAGIFDLKPKPGWEAAAGFDYRFAASPWHVSGQFRYGEGNATSSVAGSSFLDLSAIVGAAAAGAFVASNDGIAARYKETNWIADLAVGKDMLGAGPETMQLKGGLRVSEFVGQMDLSQNSLAAINFGAPLAIGGGGPLVTTISQTTATGTSIRNSFLGAGPLLGIDGSIPLSGGWAFDYAGDAAVLFGTQKTTTSVITNSAISPAILAAFGVGGPSSTTVTTNERFATVFSADVQAGVSYWVTQNVKLSASYRLDAMINVQNQSATGVTNQTPDRYTHGPHLRLSATF